MELAILFWFYKEPEICKNRLELLKKHNPDLKIFGLFGGLQEEAEEYQRTLGSFLDDFYVSPFEDPNYKWIHGDLGILDWYDKRGRYLSWDSIVVIQWDMLVFDSLKKQFARMKKGEIFLSGLKRMDKETENRWSWTKLDSQHRDDYEGFMEYVRINYSYEKPLPICLFILEIFPRLFFDKYLTVKKKELGMLEYKVPTYAEIFKIPFFEKDVGIWWFQDVPKPLNARGQEISITYINSELRKKGGWRIFHPYFKTWR